MAKLITQMGNVPLKVIELMMKLRKNPCQELRLKQHSFIRRCKSSVPVVCLILEGLNTRWAEAANRLSLLPQILLYDDMCESEPNGFNEIPRSNWTKGHCLVIARYKQLLKLAAGRAYSIISFINRYTKCLPSLHADASFYHIDEAAICGNSLSTWSLFNVPWFPENDVFFYPSAYGFKCLVN